MTQRRKSQPELALDVGVTRPPQVVVVVVVVAPQLKALPRIAAHDAVDDPPAAEDAVRNAVGDDVADPVGGLPLDDHEIAAPQVTASCDTDGVNTAYGYAYSASTPGYNVTSVSVTNINAACNGKNISVTVAKSDGSTPATGTGSVASGAANNIAVTPAITAANAGAVYVVIG